MPGYTILASQSTVHVLSATVVVDGQSVTIQTTPSAVIASVVIPQESLTSADAVDILTWFAHDIEEIMQHYPVVAATGAQTLDANGLLQYEVVFTVGYTPTGSALPPLTTQVSVELAGVAGVNTFSDPAALDSWVTAVEAAYAGLQKTAAG